MAKTGQHRRGGSEGILYYDPAFELSSKISIRINRLADDKDWRTPWEREDAPQAIAAYELEQVERSVMNLRAMGLM